MARFGGLLFANRYFSKNTLDRSTLTVKDLFKLFTMKRILSLYIAIFAACSSDQLDRDKALKIIQDEKLYPKVISYNVFIADPVYARRMLDAGLESSGLLTVQRTQKLMDLGKPLITFTDKAKPYLLPTSDKDRKDHIQLVKIADEELKKITGVQLLDGEKRAVVEYTTFYKNITPFSPLSRLKLNEKDTHKAYFLLYDDGWRLEEK
jgi:hypothetical protein